MKGRDCPEKPKTNENVRGKATLNMVGVIPSPQTSETKVDNPNTPLRVITRSQARNVEEPGIGHDQSPRPGNKMERKPRRRRQRSKRLKGKKSREDAPTSQEENNVSDPLVHPEPPDNLVVSEASSSGSVLVEKVNESLEAIKKAYESRITALTEIPPKLQEYPNPREEKINLAIHQQNNKRFERLKFYWRDHLRL